MKYVKLGENASTFNDSSSTFNISNKQIKPVGSKQKASVRFRKGLKTGHIQYASEKQYKKYIKSLNVVETVEDTNTDDPVSLFAQGLKKKELKKIKNDDLVADIIANSDIKVDDLEGFIKDDLIDIIKEDYVLPNDEDEDDDEDDDDDLDNEE